MKDRPLIPREKALEVARDIHKRLAPFCEKCTVAGSLRRDRPFVHDIEFLFIPKFLTKQPSLFETDGDAVDLADLTLCKWEYDRYLTKRLNAKKITTWGKQNKLAIHRTSGIPVDFFSTTRENWFVALVIRTGGKRTNLRLTTSANRRGLTLHAYGDGFTDRSTGENIHCASERDVFRIAGVPYYEPEKRD